MASDINFGFINEIEETSSNEKIFTRSVSSWALNCEIDPYTSKELFYYMISTESKARFDKIN